MLYKVTKFFLSFINKITPKKDNYIFFRSYFPYPDNIQAVIDEMIKEKLHYKYKLICAGNGFDKYRSYQNFLFLEKSYLKGLLFYFRSKYVIWDSSIFFNLPSVKKQISVNLWHGVSLKKIGFYENPQSKCFRMSTYVVTYSDFFAKVMSRAFAVPLTNVLTTGEPRNDYLFTPATNEEMNALGIPCNNQYKYVIWMPTFRQSKNHAVNNGKLYEFGFPFLSSKNIKALNDCARESGLIVILKWHGSQILPDLKKIGSLSNLFFLTTDMIASKNIPFYNIVGRCDALITDYSSIYVNYMVLNRPICFAYDDLDEYILDRGFMFDDVEKIMPGYKAKSIENIFSFLKKIGRNEDEYEMIRSNLSSQMNRYSDNKNAKRLIDYLGLNSNCSEI